MVLRTSVENIASLRAIIQPQHEGYKVKLLDTSTNSFAEVLIFREINNRTCTQKC